MKAVSSGTTPIQPQGVCGPMKTSEIRPRPTTIRRIRSIEPTFFDSMACILFHLENMPESCAAGSRLSVTKSHYILFRMRMRQDLAAPPHSAPPGDRAPDRQGPAAGSPSGDG